MADTKTATEWKASIAALNQQIDSLEKQQEEITDKISQLTQQQIKLLGVTRNLPPGSAERAAANQQYADLTVQIQQLKNQQSQISQQIVTLDAQVQAAERQVGVAETAPPNTSTNTSPANPDPGPNTEPKPIPPTVPPAEPVPIDTATEPTAANATTDPIVTNRTPEPADEFGNLEQAIERQQYTSAPRGDDPPFDEFAGVDEAIQQQKIIDANTSGIPIRAEDGSIAQGIAINPETGETYYTTASQGLGASINATKQATQQDQANFLRKEDWRVRLSLAPESKYLYNADPVAGILAPLAQTDGIIFPYVPNISVQYAAHYDGVDVVHNNYKIYQYKNSSVDSISITGEFTAQDTFEANYLLAVIHFLRTVTKMFYGKDQNPRAGTPPPLCYLTGLGAFQFDAHPLAITNFSYNLPTEVDYIRATTQTTLAGVNKSAEANKNPPNSPSAQRMVSTNLGEGGRPKPTEFNQTPSGTIEPTYVPTKMQISITAIPIMSRKTISNYFSVEKYATGELLQGTKTKRGGIW